MNADSAPSDFRRAARRLLGVWLALLLLLAASLGSAYLRLGVFNTVASYGIALVKIALVVVVFMRWRHADDWSRAAGFAAACALTLLAGLTWFESRTREPGAGAMAGAGATACAGCRCSRLGNRRLGRGGSAPEARPDGAPPDGQIRAGASEPSSTRAAR